MWKIDGDYASRNIGCVLLTVAPSMAYITIQGRYDDEAVELLEMFIPELSMEQKMAAVEKRAVELFCSWADQIEDK